MDAIKEKTINEKIGLLIYTNDLDYEYKQLIESTYINNFHRCM